MCEYLGLRTRAAIFFFFIIAASLWGTTYYVDYSGGNDSNDGRSSSSAWKTISKINNSTLNPGDEVLFKRGETWRETLIIPNNSILFGAYGSGDKPAILGSEELGAWTNSGSNRWSTSLSIEPISVWFVSNDSSVNWGIKKSSAGSVTQKYEWHWSSDTLYVYSSGNPQTAYRSIEPQARLDCIIGKSYSISYITLENLEIAYASRNGVLIQRTSKGWIVRDNYIHHIGELDTEQGNVIGVYGSENLISNNVAGEGGRHVIFVAAVYPSGVSVENNIIENNVVYNSYHNNIDIQNTVGTNRGAIVRGNTIYVTTDAAIHDRNGVFMQGVSGNVVEDVLIYNNVIFNMTNHGISANKYVDGVRIYNNTIYKTTWTSSSFTGCIYIGSPVSNAVIENNIGMNGKFYALQVKDPISASVNHNIWYQEPGETPTIAIINNANYTDFATYKSSTGYDLDGKNVNPLFVNPSVYFSTQNFRIVSSSPAKNAGKDLSSVFTTDKDGNSLPQGSDWPVGAFDYVESWAGTPDAPTGLRIE